MKQADPTAEFSPVHICFIPPLTFIWYKSLKEIFCIKQNTICTSKILYFIAIGNIGTQDISKSCFPIVCKKV